MAWICRFCSTSNMDGDAKCIVCDTAKPNTGRCTLTKKRVASLGLTGCVVVPSEFNVIGEGAFKDRNDITAVVLHSGVEIIEKEAFMNCKNLSDVRCVHTLESIKGKAFAECTSLPGTKRPSAERVAADAFSVTTKTTATPSYIPKPVSIYTGTSSSTVSKPIDPPVARKSGFGAFISSLGEFFKLLPKKVWHPIALLFKWMSDLDDGLFVIALNVTAAVVLSPIMVLLGCLITWGVFKYILSVVIGIFALITLVALQSYIDYSTSTYSYYVMPFITGGITILNAVLLFLIGRPYITFSVAVNLVAALSASYTAYEAFSDYETKYGICSVGLAVINVAMIVAPFILWF